MKKKEREKRKAKKTRQKPFNPDEAIEWLINKEEARISNEVFKKHFKVQKPSVMFKVLYETNDKEKNSKLVDIFNSRLKDLKEEIKNMSKKEREIENPESIVKIVEMILKFNEQNQQGKGLKLLTPNQMLYRSKNMTKQVYNNLIKYI